MLPLWICRYGYCYNLRPAFLLPPFVYFVLSLFPRKKKTQYAGASEMKLVTREWVGVLA